MLSALGVKFHCEHKTLSDYCRELGDEVVKERFKFTCVRNPWDRAVSWWAFFGNMGAQRVPFEQWLQKQAHRRNRPPTQKFHLDQMSFCRSPDGEILMDYFLRFEKLDQDFLPIAERFGIPATLPRIGQRDRQDRQRMAEAIRRSKHPERAPLLATADYRDMYKSQASIDLVAELDSETVKRFGYSFGT